MRDRLDTLLRQALTELAAARGRPELAALEPQLERTKEARHGDFTSNVALRAAKPVGLAPRELAVALIGALPPSGLVDRVDVAGPGFINFTLAPRAYHEELRAILASGPRYGCSDAGAGRRILLEYVSANPTGPLHVGHGRHAAYGASLANILRATGHAVDEEYYVNDAGRQMDILAASVWLRYAELCGTRLDFPPNGYQGDYVRDIAKAVHQEQAAALLGDPAPVREAAQAGELDAEQRLDAVIGAIKAGAGTAAFQLVLDRSIDSVLGDIRDDLAAFGIEPQSWYSERSLTTAGAVERSLALLEDRGQLYRRDGARWFKSSAYGDEKDRVVVRENGAATYFASDIAYHLDKRRRGYDHLLDVLGADHHGYVARIRAGLQAMGEPADCLEVRIVQFVVLYRGRQKVQMSTRSGEYVTLRELREEVGNDAARFFYVSRSNDQHLEFDLDLAKAQSNENPVYYVQYAHARIASMLRRLEEDAPVVNGPEREAALDQLTEAEEQSLMAELSRYPEIVRLAADNRAPQHVVHYLRSVASAFHSFYNAHKVLTDDPALRGARIALALAAQQILRNGLGMLGVSAPAAM